MVGIDAGGTSTRCAVMTLSGALAGSGSGPGANPNSGGDTAGALTTALSAAVGDLDRSLILKGVFGIAGAGAAGRPAAVAAARRAWRAVGLRGSPAVVTDIAVAFAAGSSANEGIVVFSGTGAGAAAISDGAIKRRADGYGWLVGDEGSAVWLGREAVRAVLAAYDGRGAPTLLAESVPRALLGAARLTSLGVPVKRSARHGHGFRTAREASRDTSREPTRAMAMAGSGGGPHQLQPGFTATLERPLVAPNVALTQAIIKEVYGRPPAALGRLGPVVCAAAMAGDPVARRIADEAAEWLLMDVAAVRSAIDGRCPPVVMAGSVLGSGPVSDAVYDGLRERYAVDPTRAGDGARGAAGLALRRLGLR
ncbi:ATPase [Actinomadura alba]|uniref:ATPase n=2 Tax=Actinomadura alba TaxID=406431 RepID=A0ABR7LJE0_9ACTN|nr:BadF/BadG/BcrA/BcrD ATPase family protein [Actinomadura alba]MBC6464891.1 ATPase [Actinomadura alba]